VYSIHYHRERTHELHDVKGIESDDFHMTVIHKRLQVKVHILASRTSPGRYQWEALGAFGEEDYKEKAIEAARSYILKSKH
jgi:hypothetical protein